MKYRLNYLGFSSSLNEYLYKKLDILTEALEDEVRSDPLLSHIKNVSFSLDEESPSLIINILLRSNEKISKEFAVEKEMQPINPDFLMSFFGEEKITPVLGIINDLGGVFTPEFLENKEPDLFNQLKIYEILENAPNLYEGKKLSENQISYIKEISQSI